MKKLLLTILFTSLGCWQMLASDLLWEQLSKHKLDSVSVMYLSSSNTTRIEPSADFLKQHYTHLFAERHPLQQEPFFQNLKDLISSSHPVGPLKPPATGEFRWCITIVSGDNSTTEIYASLGRKISVARIGSEYYNLNDPAAKRFFGQFTKLFGS